MVLTKVIINSITIKDDDGSPDPKKLFRYEILDESENEIGEAIISCPKSVYDLVEPQVGQVVQIYRGSSTSTDLRVFYGFVSQVKPRGGVIEIVAKNELWDLIRKNVNKVYDSSIDASAGEGSEIAEDLIETYGGLSATVVATGTTDGKKIDQFKCINTDIWERVQALKKAFNYQIRYDAAAREVHFEPRGYNDSGKTITIGTEVLNVPDWDYDSSKLVNNLQVDGATILTELRFPETNGAYGRIGTTTNFNSTDITLPNTPEIVKLTMDSSDPPTTLKIGGSKDGSQGNFYYVDKENKKVKPVTGTMFTTDDYAFVDYTWAAPAPIAMRNETSITAYGEFEKQLTFSDISSIQDAEARAVEIMARFSTPLISADLMLRNVAALNLKVGDLVTVVDNISQPPVNRTLVVVRRKINYPGDVEELSVGDAPLRVVDWQMQTEERIKRLEEELIRNQDLNVQLIQIENTTSSNNVKTYYPRWKIIYSQAYTSADNTMIWDNPDHGIWNTDNWATDANPDGFDDAAYDFVQSFDQGTANKWNEEFIDTDFKGSATTATWSGSGSATFTSGQLIETEPIDFNNGTINTVLVAPTIVSGSFDWEATADGTNWESVTPNQIHTFSDTGTNLKIRATENAASTGEISNVVVSGYH